MAVSLWQTLSKVNGKKKPKSVSWFFIIILSFEDCFPPPHALYNKHAAVAVKGQVKCCHASASEMPNFPAHFWDKWEMFLRHSNFLSERCTQCIVSYSAIVFQLYIVT